MERKVILICGMWIVLGCQGLEMTMDRTESQTLGARVAYCFLDCEENLESSSSSPVNISRMSIFKKVPHVFNDNDSSEKGNPVASLTLEEPRLSHVSDSVKVDGLLETKRSTLHIDMFDKADCLAAYTCEVQTVDASGNFLTAMNRLRQQQVKGKGQDPDGAMTSPISVQLLAVVHQLDTKLALLGQSSNILQDKIGSLERRLENKIWSVEEKINTIEPHLENKIESLGKEMESLKDHLGSKIDRHVVDKLCQLDARVSKREAITGDVEEEEQKTFTDASLVSGNIGDQINSMSRVLLSLKKDVIQLKTLEDENQLGLKKLATGVTNIFESNEDIAQMIRNDSVVSQDKSNLNAREYDFNLMNRSIDMISSVQDLYSNTNATIVSSVKSAVVDLLQPKSCRRGVAPVLTYSSFPYPVVFPSEESGLDVPYLCDPLTDGGGWIIIQRRSTGNVDFYRDWDTYKEGFGSLDGDVWLGNEKIHDLTSNGVYELRIEIMFQGRFSYANYDRFALGDEGSKYTIRIGRYSGTAGDSLKVHDGEPFSTFDKDHDLFDRNCAEVFTGAWWYKACHHSNLNGKWQAVEYKGPNWQTVSRGDPVSYSEIKIRLKNQARRRESTYT